MSRAVPTTIEPGRVVAIAGRSGAGKSTLLEALAADSVSAGTGYVPQDDIVHRDLPVTSVLRYAAKLRRAWPSDAEVDARVAEILAVLGLAGRAHRRVGTLSGGERKRVSIGVELLDHPQVIFLDEPTSGLDPATAAALMRTLRRLADTGTAVVLTTHSTDDIYHCDRLVFLAPGGAVAYDGPVEDAAAHFGVDRLAAIYERIDAPPGRTADRTGEGKAPSEARFPHQYVKRVSVMRQFRALVARNLELLAHNRMSTAIMLGSPALVVAMFVVLFQPGAIARDGLSSPTANMTAFWLAFAAFFFGLTFGLLQIVTELPLVRRERFVGVHLGAYLAAKLAVLVPVLLLVVSAMVAVLRACDRLPSMDMRTTTTLVVTLLLDAIAALTLGLLASALVRDASQATLALPMLCFPAVLFSGGVLPVAEMPLVGRAISAVTTNRWGFDAVGRVLGLQGAPDATWPRIVLVAFASFFLVLAARTLRARTDYGIGTRYSAAALSVSTLRSESAPMRGSSSESLARGFG